MIEFPPPRHAYDIFFLSIGTVPGWWVHNPEIRQVVDSVISDLESRNPGLDINPRWINVMCYGGTDPYYRPFIGVRNNLSGSNAGEPLESDLVYYYPGTSYINNNPSLAFRYYTDFLMMGNIWYRDEQNNREKRCVYNFSLADKYLPPLRNESDPAKLPLIDRQVYTNLPSSFTPDRYQNIRVAVHPENIAYEDTGIPNREDISLRVYAYQLDPMQNILPNDRIEYITLLIGPLENNSYSVTMTAIEGGVQPRISGYYKIIDNQQVDVELGSGEVKVDRETDDTTMEAYFRNVINRW
ncbi:MAG: hypothetical protein RMJ51_03090 [Candidatus Calescibacterium sp.]|nr:hypothetical protein [Candidatus Calescibacterium sp.]MDW8195211.1 hypothetical protein [Candidatus Calescibacterium sp.]